MTSSVLFERMYGAYPKSKKMSLSIKKRWEIVFLSRHEYGPKWSVTRISKYLKVGKNTVKRWLARYEKTGDVIDIPKSGAKRKTCKKGDSVLKKIVEKHPEATVAELQTILSSKGVNLSRATIKRRLKEFGFKSKGAKPIPLLTERHITNRYNWAVQHQDFDWDTTVFTDECSFVMDNKQKKFWVKDKEIYVVKKVKHPLKVHVWGCFSRNGFGKLVLFTKNLDANFMCEIYKKGLLPSITKMFGGNSDNWYLQEDNDPKHRSRICSKFKEDNNIKVLPWPSMSPDVNPIENVWGIMKMKIAGKPKRTLLSFKRQLKSIWKELPQSLADKLVDSMQNRVKSLIDRNGDYIGY